ncbi:hypothetical protein AURDEDRAFT_176024 [Auricularia subglabra TFB-10046 SS5]|uniref:F-box domain-containing protein n=1 Tax=Auricularia subglabra (strain TFB-10046 / SS5) TaxID=717982 RepID=J0LDY6_AURST|nr:hypothetical protein AURDEDRAFT_176024 [Auricularia subglabra TFB-10046 SS5]
MRKIQSPEYTVEKFIAKVRKDARPHKWANLPTGVLALVFEELLTSSDDPESEPDSFRDLAAARLVCSAWNDVIMSHPALWRFVVVRGAHPPMTTLTTIFETSGNISLSVTLDFRRPLGKSAASIRECSDVCGAVSRYLERIESLAIVLAVDHQSLALKYLDRATPRLKTLSVSYSDPSEHNVLAPLKRGLFMNDLSRLRTMRLGYTGLSAVFKPRKPLPSLRILELSDKAFDWFELEAAFAACPELEDLTMHGFNFKVFNGKLVPAGELAVSFPLRRLALQSARVTDINNQDFLAAFARMPLRAAAEVQLGRAFAPWHRPDDTCALLETFFDHLPALETLGVDMGDDLFEMEGMPNDAAFTYGTVSRSIELPEKAEDLFRAQDPLRDALARALMQPKRAFKHLSALRMPLTFWYYVPDSVDGMLPYLTMLEAVWDLPCGIVDPRVPSLPHLVSLAMVRLIKPVDAGRMLLGFDKVERLLVNYDRAQELVLALCDIRVIQGEDDDQRSLVARVVIEQ